MFEVVPEPEFSAWFEALPDPYAEEVAAAIDLTANASSALMPERLSRLLLWYDGAGNAPAPDVARQLDVFGLPSNPVHDYLAWHHEVVLCLESPAFRERLARLEPREAEHVLGLVERIRARLRAARVTTTYNPWRRDPRGAFGEWPGVRDVFTELLASLGLATPEVLGSGSGLRELSIGNIRPPLRVLFGLDFPARRLIAILGETLDRNYYGDSVKRAEKRWQQYLDAQARNLQQRTP
jgi:hypothetical protein